MDSSRWKFSSLLLGLLCCLGSGGCNLFQRWGFTPPPVPEKPAHTVELRDDGVQVLEPPPKGSLEEKLLGARDYFRREDYVNAERLYYHTANQKDIAPSVAQEALFYRAECYRLQGKYPEAADTYKLLLSEYPRNPYRAAATRHCYEIANYWLDDTRAEMVKQNKGEGSGFFSGGKWFNFEKTKPFTDSQGRAIQLLEQVHFSDIRGEDGLGPQALFLAGGVEYFNERWEEADHYFTQIHENHPNHKLAPKAIEYAIQAKQMSTGGPEYDGRKVAEARLLVQSALRNYPELARNKKAFLNRQLATLDLQQAAKDYKKAKFYNRTGHPASGYFYCQLVMRRYPGTKYAQDASLLAEEIRTKNPELNVADLKQRTKALPQPLEKVLDAPVKRTPTLPPPAQPSLAPPPRPLPADLTGN